MTVTSPVTDNEITLRIPAEDRAAMKETATKHGLTYTQVYLAIEAGTIKPLKVTPAKRRVWVGVKFYLTTEQADLLFAEAERLNTTPSKIVRAKMFLLPKTPTQRPVKAKSLYLKNAVAEPVRAALAELRDLPKYSHTKLMPEGAALVEVAGILILREANLNR